MLNKNEIFLNDNKIAFGKFPKSIVYDSELINKLNNLESVNDIVYLDGEQYLKITKGSIEEVIESNFITTSGDVIYSLAYKYINDDHRYFYNNYEESTIRNYLNNNFYNEAFNEDEKRCIIKTLVVNQVETTKYTSNPYVCANTFDYIYIPSYKDINNAEYKFVDDASRTCDATPYAIELGAKISFDDIYHGNAIYYLRSPDGYYDNKVSMVNSFGSANDIMDVTREDGGIRPMMNIVIK